MTIQVNCFTIQASGTQIAGVPLLEGIELSAMGGVAFVYLGGSIGVDLDLESYPARDATHLLRARVIPGRWPALSHAPEDTRSIVVRVECADLRFGFPALADGLNLWPGGDGDLRPFKQFGEHKNGTDIQNGESILVVDQSKAVACLTCVDGQPKVSHPTVLDLAEFLRRRAKAQRKVQALDWALHNLRALSSNEEHRQAIQTAMSELDRLRQTA